MRIAVYFRRLAVLALFLGPRALDAQPVEVGSGYGFSAGNTNPTSVTTFVQSQVRATQAGDLTTAVFGWSASPCLAAVKLKFFRLQAGSARDYAQVAERGPFDVTAPAVPVGSLLPIQQRVSLSPAVTVQGGDIIAITNLTTCGGPTYEGAPPGSTLPEPSPAMARVAGDATTFSLPSTFERSVYVYASGGFPEVSTLRLLNRFDVRLTAPDPRTGRHTNGKAIPLAPAVGYFSLPDFTGDPTLPEIMIKMVDATASPSLGGDFWFFHAPLTDVAYTLLVQDVFTGALRTFNSSSGNPGQLCGGADTSAFSP